MRYAEVMQYEVDEAQHPALNRPKIVDKPWGREVWWAHEAGYAGKLLAVTAGHRLSLQKHVHKEETLMLVDGRAEVLLGEDTFVVTPGQAFTVKPDTVHRYTALEDSVLLEVSTPHLDDVVRLQDDYARA